MPGYESVGAASIPRILEGSCGGSNVNMGVPESTAVGETFGVGVNVGRLETVFVTDGELCDVISARGPITWRYESTASETPIIRTIRRITTDGFFSTFRTFTAPSPLLH